MSCGLWKETYAMAEDYVKFSCTSPQLATPLATPPPSESATAMRRLAQDMEKQHQARFHSLAQSFLRQCGPDPCPCLRKVMEELVGDGHLNWGRVVSLFTFTGVLARLLLEQKKKPGPDPGKWQEVGPDQGKWQEVGADQGKWQEVGADQGKWQEVGADQGKWQEVGPDPGTCRGLAETIADYLGEEKKGWLLENDGWDGFCKFSRSGSVVRDDSSMKTALFAAAGVGIAGLTFLLVR